MPPENNQAIEEDLGDAELQQWLTSVGDGADIQLPGLDIGIPQAARNMAGIAQRSGETSDQLPNPDLEDEETDEPFDPASLQGTDPDEAGEPQNAPTPTATDAPTSDDFFTLPNGGQISKADAERLHQFDQFLRANPDAAQRVQAAIPAPAPATGGQPDVPTSTAPADQTPTFEAPEPPEWMDLEDPEKKWQWDNHVDGLKARFDIEQRTNAQFARQATERQETVQRQAAADMSTALDRFKQAHPNLNEDDLVSIRKAAGPFVSGMLAQLSPVDALFRSMEVGGMMDDDLRGKLMDTSVRTPTEKTRTRHRKARLGELSGSARSAPKTESRPVLNSDKDLINALAQEFSETMQR